MNYLVFISFGAQTAVQTPATRYAQPNQSNFASAARHRIVGHTLTRSRNPIRRRSRSKLHEHNALICISRIASQ